MTCAGYSYDLYVNQSKKFCVRICFAWLSHCLELRDWLRRGQTIRMNAGDHKAAS
ncbi:hypothetical protein Q31b_50220 [Novipirellula aureliae]|uniref:Uncharacterized protein n=1 Tax=Novipirellula aureliae TaxID=2527966 RepID=A0A5C6DIU8_9BACT|nr:hypothetical protein Q31b_50220 [Novipirellula aureliae]